MDWNGRKSTSCLWSSLVISTFVLCVCFTFINFFYFETDYSSITRRTTNQIPQSEKLTGQNCTPVCGSKDCVLQSKILLEYVQPASNPCDDFYKFACGKYLGNHFEKESFVSRCVKRMRIKLRNILENLEPNADSVSEKMKIVYNSCVKRSSEFQDVRTLLQILDEFGLESWPNITPDFKFENATLTNVMANLLVHDEYGFVMLDRYNQQQILRLSIGESSYEKKELDLIKYQINRILKYFKFDDEAIIKIQEDAEAVHSATRYLRDESLRLHDEGVITLERDVNCSKEMENEWMYLCEVSDFFVDIAKANEEVNKKYLSIEASDIYFMQNIFPLLRNFTDRSIANYLAINVFLNHLNDLNLYFRLIHQKGISDVEKLDDLAIPIDRWKYCVDWVSREMTLGLAYEYMKKEFTTTMLDELTNFTNEMIHETAEYFSRQEWVSETLREEMTEQTRNIVTEAQFLKNFTAKNFVDKLYEEFKPTERSFLSNIMGFRKFLRVTETRGFPAKELSRHFRQTFLPGASGGGGQLTIRIGILLPPLYSPRVKRIFNIVSLGMIIVHEIGHNIFYGTNIEQFNQEEKHYFQTKMKCIADQVSQYRFELLGKNPNGSHYSNEDIADNVAVPIIDKLIEKYLSEGNDSTLPGLHYSTKQMLYASSALTWCSVTSKEKEELAYTMGTHSPELFRVYQLMRNSKGFSEAFQCPVGSFMNPADKCLMLTGGEAM